MTSDFEIMEMSVYDIPDVLMHERKAFGKMAWSSKDFESAINSSYDYPFVVHKKAAEAAWEMNSSDGKKSKDDSESGTLTSSHIDSFCADSVDTIAGYSVLRVLAPEAEIEDICVSEDMRKLGIGEKLLRHMIAVAKEKEAEKPFILFHLML